MSTTQTRTSGGSGTTSPDRIVVAVGGTSTGRGALAWAGAEAARRGLTVQLLAAVPVTPNAAALREPNARMMSNKEDLARQELETLAESLRSTADVLPVATVTGPVREVLHEHLDEHVAVLVLGHRPMHAAQRIMTGSTSIALAGRSPVPVVVVPDGWTPSEASGTETPPVVVGVTMRPGDDGYEGDPDVLTEAFERAHDLQAPLVAVHAWEIPALLSWSTNDIARFRDRVQTALEEFLAPWREKYPDVTVDAYAVAERPADALSSASRVAQLTVVGRHTPASRHGGFHLGSTARGVLHHAEVPVLVVPTESLTEHHHHVGAPASVPTY
jgi:nucleotide-binding universal stress UspA family protein